MASSDGEVAVFANTSLGTHLAVPISPDITAAEFKRELESIHSNHFPEIGDIRVHKLMVKRRSCFYHLPESLPIKHAFQGLEGTWFINMEAYPRGSSECDLIKRVEKEVRDHISDESNATGYFKGSKRKSTKWKRNAKKKIKRFYCLRFVLQEIIRAGHCPKKNKRRKRIGKACFLNDPIEGLGKVDLDIKENVHVEKENLCPVVEAHSRTISESVSVSGIINKYFSGYGEVTSRSEMQWRPTTEDNCFKTPIDRLQQSAEKTPPTVAGIPFHANACSGSSRDKHRRSDVGQGLVMASNKLGISASKQKPTISVCRYTQKKQSALRSSRLIRSLVFEISDEDE